MRLDTSNILYLFDFDGTLFGTDTHNGILQQAKSALKDGPYINPHDYGVRWSILTSRPRIDFLFVLYVCQSRKLFPEFLWTSSTLTWKFKNKEETYAFKSEFIKKILNGTNRKCPKLYKKVYYIDNDLNCVKYLNHNRGNYDYLSMTIFDWKKDEFQNCIF